MAIDGIDVNHGQWRAGWLSTYVAAHPDFFFFFRHENGQNM